MKYVLAFVISLLITVTAYAAPEQGVLWFVAPLQGPTGERVTERTKGFLMRSACYEYGRCTVLYTWHKQKPRWRAESISCEYYAIPKNHCGGDK